MADFNWNNSQVFFCQQVGGISPLVLSGGTPGGNPEAVFLHKYLIFIVSLENLFSVKHMQVIFTDFNLMLAAA